MFKVEKGPECHVPGRKGRDGLVPGRKGLDCHVPGRKGLDCHGPSRQGGAVMFEVEKVGLTYSRLKSTELTCSR
jgi:hypothetical protein